MTPPDIMTVCEAKRLLNVSTNNDLADALGIKRQAITNWKGIVPELRRFQVLTLAKGA